MTDRHSGYIVTLKHDIREDDAEQIRNALRMVKGVLSVRPLLGGGTVESFIARQRVQNEVTQKLLSMLDELSGGES